MRPDDVAFRPEDITPTIARWSAANPPACRNCANLDERSASVDRGQYPRSERRW
jgi:hypothetical protein